MTSVPLAAEAGAARPAATLPIRLVCHGCGEDVTGRRPVPLRCPRARDGDDVDHVLERAIATDALAFPADGDVNPFIRFRELLYGYHAARAAGASDAGIVAQIRELDRRVAQVDGRGFAVTPLFGAGAVASRIGHDGPLWIKDETGNVSGSHKARHLFGTLLEQRLVGGPDVEPPLAIASCGNAALAAAVIARAGARRLLVFIPTTADPGVAQRLVDLGAQVEICSRRPGEVGDPTYWRLREAIAAGALPFTCQGNLNGLAIEGGMTLGWELVSGLAERDATLDHLVLQVGGGALGSAVAQALDEARRLGALPRMPRIHTVQTRGAFPLARAHARLAAEFERGADDAAIDAAVERAARHRSTYMWPWETEPYSVAGGILDDETYDWLALVRAMLRTDGRSLVVDEGDLETANAVARTTGIDVDHTGSAGLAGVIELLRLGEIGPDESVAVIFTGVRRHPAANGGLP